MMGTDGRYTGFVSMGSINGTQADDVEKILSGYGTVFIGAASFSTPRPPAPDPMEVRADEIIERWKNSKGGWKKLRKLIAEALDDVCYG